VAEKGIVGLGREEGGEATAVDHRWRFNPKTIREGGGRDNARRREIEKST
jgi:hypothetical protein